MRIFALLLLSFVFVATMTPRPPLAFGADMSSPCASMDGMAGEVCRERAQMCSVCCTVTCSVTAAPLGTARAFGSAPRSRVEPSPSEPLHSFHRSRDPPVPRK